VDTLSPITLNFIYAALGGAMSIFFMWVATKIFNHMMNFNISDELARGNIAVGLMMTGLFIGIGVAMGLVIGLGLS
jgi:uncharacterized membrane protein YjfL (UPF0719 family)